MFIRTPNAYHRAKRPTAETGKITRIHALWAMRVGWVNLERTCPAPSRYGFRRTTKSTTEHCRGDWPVRAAEKARLGHALLGLCPFHSENTPSFNVNGALGFYKCFGCDAKGDVFKFIQERENLTFPETLKLLAERYGIPMPERQQRPDDAESRKRAALYEMQEIAASTFQDNLRVFRRRGDPKICGIAQRFEGFNGRISLGLSGCLRPAACQEAAEVRPGADGGIGFGRKRDDGSFYDHFRARLMFPIHNEARKVIGFGGRALRPDEKAKYMNSPTKRAL